MKKINNKNIKLLAYVLSGDFSAENMKVTRSELKMVEDCPRGVYFIDFTEPISRFIACKRYWNKELDGFEKEKVGYQLLNELSELISKHSWFYWQNGESGKYSFSFSAEFSQKLNDLRRQNLAYSATITIRPTEPVFVTTSMLLTWQRVMLQRFPT